MKLGSVILGLVAWLACVPAELGAQRTPAPDRNGDRPGDGDNTSCPPGPDSNTKGAPNAALGDMNVGGDSNLDYFMGEYKFVETVDGVERNVIVRKWCINNPRDGQGRLQDYFSYQIFTSLRGRETLRVPSAAPI